MSVVSSDGKSRGVRGRHSRQGCQHGQRLADVEEHGSSTGALGVQGPVEEYRGKKQPRSDTPMYQARERRFRLNAVEQLCWE